MKPTLEDIARESGFSKSTVSRVLSSSGSTSKETRELIEEIALKLGYERQPSTNGGIGAKLVFVFSTNLHYCEHVRFIKILTDHYWKRGILVCAIDTQRDSNLEYSFLKFASNHHIYGAILLSARLNYDIEHYEAISRLHCPVVIVNRLVYHNDFDTVRSDKYHAGIIAARYLLEHNHKDVAILCGPEHSYSAQNLTLAFLDTYMNAGLAIPKERILYAEKMGYEDGYKFGASFSKNCKATAVCCTSIDSACGFADSIHHAGWVIPRDVSLICIETQKEADNHPTITTVCNDELQIAFAAAELLEQRKLEKNMPVRNLVFSPRLVDGKSVRAISE